jgi:16S rRNA (cytosine967-C5)-methyltransferase
VERFLDEHPEFQLDRLDKALPEKLQPFIREGFFKTFPPRDGMDGFFVARLIRKR